MNVSFCTALRRRVLNGTAQRSYKKRQALQSSAFLARIKRTFLCTLARTRYADACIATFINAAVRCERQFLKVFSRHFLHTFMVAKRIWSVRLRGKLCVNKSLDLGHFRAIRRHELVQEEPQLFLVGVHHKIKIGAFPFGQGSVQ